METQHLMSGAIATESSQWGGSLPWEASGQQHPDPLTITNHFAVIVCFILTFQQGLNILQKRICYCFSFYAAPVIPNLRYLLGSIATTWIPRYQSASRNPDIRCWFGLHVRLRHARQSGSSGPSEDRGARHCTLKSPSMLLPQESRRCGRINRPVQCLFKG